MAAAEAPPPPAEPDVEEVDITVEEVDWIVRVVGRSGGARPSATPLLLLGFWRAGSPEGERERETLVVGRALADLSPARLRAALEESEAPPEPPTGPPPGRGRERRGRDAGSSGRGR